MSIPLGFLAILTDGPAYGSQLHSEFVYRAAHRDHLNAGQVYSTLERLRKHQLIRSAGTTVDDLPLYELTPAGKDRAQRWLSGDDVAGFTSWDEVEDQVLISASLPHGHPTTVIARYLASVESELPVSVMATNRAQSAAASARTFQLRALITWLTLVAEQLDADPSAFLLPRAAERPRRGRRPSPSQKNSNVTHEEVHLQS